MDDEELEMDKSRLREIENNLEALIKEHYQLAVDVCASGDNFNERISKLERHYVYQIDENRKISRRVDELELVLPPNQAGLQNVYDEFKLITGNGFFRDYKKHFDAISDTLDNLTKFVMTIEDRIKRLERKVY